MLGRRPHAPELEGPQLRVLAGERPFALGPTMTSSTASLPRSVGNQRTYPEYGLWKLVAGAGIVALATEPQDDHAAQPIPSLRSSDYGNCRTCLLLVTRAREALGDLAVARSEAKFSSSVEVAEFWAKYAGRFIAIAERLAAHLPEHGQGVTR